ncbi:MAG: hypothetical protein JW781_10935 [Deltaproteobacteria bacterium]|nr:hypothetical protein [Candidatus Anaeroferrophillacea bacterium]
MGHIIASLRERSDLFRLLFFAFLAFAVVFDFFAVRHHAHFWGDHIIGFWAFVGLVGCLGMIVIFKGLAKVWLMKGEDFYGN